MKTHYKNFVKLYLFNVGWKRQNLSFAASLILSNLTAHGTALNRLNK